MIETGGIRLHVALGRLSGILPPRSVRNRSSPTPGAAAIGKGALDKRPGSRNPLVRIVGVPLIGASTGPAQRRWM